MCPRTLGFPRAFAHWMVADIPADVDELAENASGTPMLPRGAREFASDFVTFRIPGYGRGYGGPWPPDDAHRYVFTLYALKIATASSSTMPRTMSTSSAPSCRRRSTARDVGRRTTGPAKSTAAAAGLIR